jgi:phytoene/squalene synthetase
MLTQGAPLRDAVDSELRIPIDLFYRGGIAILDGIAAQDYDVLRGRPMVTRGKKLKLLARAFLDKLGVRRSSGVSPA